VIEAAEEFVSSGVLEDETASDATAEREQVGSAQTLDEACVTGEDDAEQLASIEFLAGEHAQLGEDAGERFLSLVDDEDRTRESRGDVVVPASAQGLEATPAVVRLERDAEEVTELAIEIAGARLRVLDRADDDVPHRREATREEAERDALARAGITGDEDVAAIRDPEFDATEEGVDTGGGVERVDRDIRSEGIEFEAVERLQFGAHESFSSSW
jgi:hypothetical protein